MLSNRKRFLALLAGASMVAVLGACGADATAPAPVTPLGWKQPLKLDTALMCPYGWVVVNGVVVCDEA